MAGFFEASLDPTQPDSWDSAARKRKLAEVLLAKSGALDNAPIQSWTQGLNKMAQAWLAGSMERKADSADKDRESAFTSKLGELLMGGTPSAAASTTSAPPPVAMASDGQPAPTPPANIPAGPLTDAIQAAAAKHGIDPAYLTRTAQIESNYGQALQSPLSSAGGPFAFTNGTARQYGLSDKNDPNASAEAAARLALDNKAALAKALGRDPGNPELYLAHQQGAGGASALLSNPQANVVDALTPVYRGNRAAALQAVRNNGGSPDMTAGQFAGKWLGKFGGGQTAQANPADLPSPGGQEVGGAPLPPGAEAFAGPSPLALAAALSGNAPMANMPQIPGSDPTLAASGFSPFPGAQAAAPATPDAPAVPPGAGAPADVPAPAAQPAGGADALAQILAATKMRAMNPQPGDQTVPLGSAQEQAFTRLEGQPNPADMRSPGAVPAGGAPMPPQGAPVDRTRQLMMLAMDPRFSPQQRQQAMQMATILQGQDKATYQTTQDGTVLQMDPHGRLPPKVVYQGGKDATYGVIGQDRFGRPQYGFIDGRNQKITPTEAGGSQRSGVTTVPGLDGKPVEVPDGMDPKVFQETLSKRAAESAAGPKSDDVSALRKEVMNTPSYKNLSQAAPIYRSMVETAGTNSRASDLNLVYGLGKIMDPNSVVREGEMVMVKNTASLPDWLVGTANSLNGGQALTPQTRAAILKEAHNRVQSYAAEYQNDTEHYRGIATRNKMNVDDVIRPFGPFNPWEPPKERVKVSSPDEARKLPKGTPIILPDGREGVVP